LHTARLLAKHQAFSAGAAKGLLRSLAFELIDGSHDLDQLRRAWQQLDAADRRDAIVVARAARRAVKLGAAQEARQWLQPPWDDFANLGADERRELALALMQATEGIGAEWLPQLELAQRNFPTDSALQAAAGSVFAQRRLWGKARRPLESAAMDPELNAAARRGAWRSLAQLAREEGDAERAARCDQAAAALD
jgi:HemY protein